MTANQSPLPDGCRLGFGFGFFKYSRCSAALLQKVLPKKHTLCWEPMMAESSGSTSLQRHGPPETQGSNATQQLEPRPLWGLTVQLAFAQLTGVTKGAA